MLCWRCVVWIVFKALITVVIGVHSTQQTADGGLCVIRVSIEIRIFCCCCPSIVVFATDDDDDDDDGVDDDGGCIFRTITKNSYRY